MSDRGREIGYLAFLLFTHSVMYLIGVAVGAR
jgi:hypothetical protein